MPISNIFTQSNYFSSYIDIKAISAPSSPSSGIGRVFYNINDSKLYLKKSDGTFVDLTGTGVTTFSGLTDTNFTSLTTGDLPIYNSVSGDWENGKIVNANVDNSAAIAYSKLNLTNSIIAGDITSNAVTTAKILDANVTLDKLASNSVNSAKIVDDSIVNDDINSAAAIDTSKLADSANFLLTTNTKTVTNKTIDAKDNTLLHIDYYLFSVFKSGSTYYLKNNNTGVIVTSNTNPTTVLQAAIDNCHSNSAATCWIEAGTYLLPSQLDASDKNFRFVGEGAMLTGNIGITNTDTQLKADYTGAAGEALFKMVNTTYCRQSLKNLVIHCNDTVDRGIDAFDVRERYPWLENVAVVHAAEDGIRANHVVYTTCYNVVISACGGSGLHLYNSGTGDNNNTFYMFGGRITSNDINVEVDESTDIAFHSVVMENGTTACVDITAAAAKQIRFRDCSFENHPGSGSSSTPFVKCGGVNIVFDGCRFDSNDLTYYPVTFTSTSKNAGLVNCLFQANNGSTTAHVTIDASASKIFLLNNIQDTNTPLTVTVTDNGTDSRFFNNTFVNDKFTSFTDVITLKDSTTNNAGDILKNNGTRFTRLARGSANNILRVNSGGSDVEWGAVPDAALSTNVVLETISNTFGDFNQFFGSGFFRILNPARTFSYAFVGSAIGANRNVTIPLLTASDIMVTAAFAQTLTNKTVNATDNTITDTSTATGDVLKSNGTKFVRLARGTAHQILAVNAGGTDLAYTNPIPTTYDYVISKISTTYYATKSGELVPKYSGTDLVTVCDSAATDLGATGGVIAFAANTTFTTANAAISLKNNITWRGMDRITSVIQNSTAHWIFYWNDGGGAQLSQAGITDLHMKIFTPNTTEGAVYIDGSTNCKFNRNWVESTATPAVATIAAFFDTQSLAHYHDNLEFKDNWFTGNNNGQDAFGSGNLRNCIVTGNTFKDHTDGQAIGAASPVFTIFSNNMFENVGNAIGLETVSEDNIISNNHLYNTTGIKLAGFNTTDNSSARNLVTGNIIEYGAGGIEDGDGTDDVISNNQFIRTEVNGIYGTFTRCKISGNKFIDTNFGNNTTTVNSISQKDGGILLVNNSTPQPSPKDNIIENNHFIDTGATFTDPIGAGSESGHTGSIVIDTDYDNTYLLNNVYTDLENRSVIDYGTNTIYNDIDNHNEFDIAKNRREIINEFNIGDGTYGSGFMNVITAIGSDNGYADDTTDYLARYYGTAATTGSKAGAVTGNGTSSGDWAVRKYLPRMFSTFKLYGTTTNHAIFIGFTASLNGSEVHATAPLNTIAGIGVAVTTDKANYQIVHSSGAGACTFVDTGIAKDTAVRTIEIWTDDTNWYARFDKGLTHVITTNMPAQTTAMCTAWHNLTNDNVTQYLYLYRLIVGIRTGP